VKQRQFIAIPLVLVILGFIFLIFAASVAGLWAWLLVGAIGLVGLALLAFWLAKTRSAAPGSAPAALPPPGSDGVAHVLVIAEGVCTAEALRAAIVEPADGRPIEAFVVAPTLGSALDRLTGDQQGYDQATQHLDETVRALQGLGAQARGKISSRAPLQAVEDGMREFPANRVVLAVRPAGDRGRAEEDAVDVARKRHGVPITVIVLDAG
jgi:hypothetical protein